jgi:L-fuculose-phosphate aldolase
VTDDASVDAVRRALVEAGRHLHERGLLAGRAGNLSARLDDGRIVVTPRGVRKDRMEPADLLVIDLADPSPGALARATTEWPLHRACHAAWIAPGAVVHAHPPALTALGLIEDGAVRLAEALPEADAAVGGVATVPFAPSGSEELADAATHAIREGGSVLLLARHGAVSLGLGVWAAVDAMELAELSARALLMAR